MKKQREEIVRFLVWMRNGSAFCISWFLILWLFYNGTHGITWISTEALGKLVVLAIGGVFLFSALFTRVFIKKWSFLSRLTCFMVVISLGECAAFYWLGFFVRTGTGLEWLAFVGIVLVLYLVCILIYQQYSRRKGVLYTEALEKYKEKRSMEHGK